MKIDDKKLQETLWNELLTLTGHSQEAINYIITNGNILHSVEAGSTPATALSYFGETSIIVPLTILHFETSLATFSHSSDPDGLLTPMHMNLISTWLSSAPTLLGIMVNPASRQPWRHFDDSEQIYHGLQTESPEVIAQIVQNYSPQSSPFGLIHVGSSDDHTGHFYLASYSEPPSLEAPATDSNETPVQDIPVVQVSTDVLSKMAMVMGVSTATLLNKFGQPR